MYYSILCRWYKVVLVSKLVHNSQYKLTKSTQHIMKELISKYGKVTKFSIVKVRDLLIAKGVPKKDAKSVKKATVVSQW